MNSEAIRNLTEKLKRGNKRAVSMSERSERSLDGATYSESAKNSRSEGVTVRRGRGLLIVVLLFSLLMPFLPVRGQGPTPTPPGGSTWALSCDFTIDNCGWTVFNSQGAYVTDTGFVDVAGSSGGPVDWLYVQMIWPTNAHIVAVRMVYSVSGADASSGADMFRAWDGTAPATGSQVCSYSGDVTVGVHDTTQAIDCTNARSWLWALSTSGTASHFTLTRLIIYGVDALPVTLTPSPTSTITPSSTFGSGELFPTSDTRPLCTATPVLTASATHISMIGSRTPVASWTPNPSWTATPTPEWHVTDMPTLTATATRSVGDCRLPEASGHEPIVDVGFTSCEENTPGPTPTGTLFDGYMTGGGSCHEDCYTIIPDINISGGVFSAVVSAINSALGTSFDTAGIVFEKTNYCFSYRKVTLAMMGTDYTWAVTLSILVTLIGFVIWTLRHEL